MDKNWLAVTKKIRYERYQLMTSFDSDILISIRKYIDYVDSLREKNNIYVYDNEERLKDIIDLVYTIDVPKSFKYKIFITSLYTLKPSISLTLKFVKKLEIIDKMFKRNENE